MGILRLLCIVFPANLDWHIAGAIKAMMHCSSQPVGWASEEALQLQFLVIMAVLHTSSHHRALILTQQGKSISIISTVRPTAERIECQESQRRRKWADRWQEEWGTMEGLQGTCCRLGVHSLPSFSLHLSPTALLFTTTSRGRGLWESMLHGYTKLPGEKVKGRLDKQESLSSLHMTHLPLIRYFSPLPSSHYHTLPLALPHMSS